MFEPANKHYAIYNKNITIYKGALILRVPLILYSRRQKTKKTVETYPCFLLVSKHPRVFCLFLEIIVNMLYNNEITQHYPIGAVNN